MKFNPGDTIEEKYRVLSILGTGAFGTVYLADDLFLKRKLAIKLLHGVAFRNDPQLLKRFEREAKILSGMAHANIVSVYKFGYLADGTPLLELEYVPGESLRSFLDREGPLSCQQSVSIARQIALALKYAHTCSVVHRDLKPENILLCKQSDKELIAKLADFGLSKQHDANSAPGAGSTLTDPGELIGTPNYMSPELCLGKGAVWQSDMYSLACVLYEMLCGVTPFEGINLSETILNHVAKDTPRLRSFPGTEELPEQLDAVIEICTRKVPEKRFATYDELIELLSQPELKDSNARLSAKFGKGAQAVKKNNKTPSVFLAIIIPVIFLLGLFLTLTLRSNTSAVVDAGSCLVRVKNELLAGEKKKAAAIAAEFLRQPDCKRQKLAEFCLDCLAVFEKAEDKVSAELCAISAFEALVDECKERMALGKPVDDVLLKQLDEISAYLLENTKKRKDWSKIYSIVSAHTEVPSNQQIMGATESLETLKLWYEAALKKGTPDSYVVDEMAGIVWRLFEQDRKKRVNFEPYFAFLKEQLWKFDIVVRQCEYHIYVSAYFKKKGETAQAQEELRKYEELMTLIGSNTAEPEMNRLRELKRKVLAN